MGTTGIIFAAIAIAWLAYLVPHFARRREDDAVAEADPAGRFSDSVRIVRHGTAPLLDQDLGAIRTHEVSTPDTRRAAVQELRRLEAQAARRRRTVLLVLLGALSLVVGLAAPGLAPWGLVALPGCLLVAFVVLARVSVRRMRRGLDARHDAIRLGGTEETVVLSRPVTAEQPEGSSSTRVVRGAPAEESAGGLWEPVPITMPTYVSKPLAPRTVRTIDLSGPGLLAARQEGPVTADARPAASSGAGAHPVEVDETAYVGEGETRHAASA